MPALIFDIETVGENYDALDDSTKDILTRWIEKEAENEKEYKVQLEELKQGLGFSPLTGEVVAIGVMDYDTKKGAVYYQAPGVDSTVTEEKGIQFKPMAEKAMLEQFWKTALSYKEFVTFNGRGFDVPFLMIRSAIHGIRPTRDLMEGRYLYQQRSAVHIDLFDQLTFYGSMKKKGGLHLWSRAFGIPSPKAGGVTGDDVSALYREKKFLEIAKYNVGDLVATRELYDKWKTYLNL